MERPLSTLIFKVLGIIINISPLLADSLVQNTSNLISDFPLIVPPLPPSPPPRSSSPPPPLLATVTPSPPAKPERTHSHPPPPPRKNRLRGPNNSTGRPSHSHHIRNPSNKSRRNHQIRKGHDKKSNLGKKIGLLFAAIAVFLQFPVIGFLVYKRKQISKIKDKQDTSRFERVGFS